ncbi:hypothetical protein BH24ACI1_BH24ACI1_22520 [soil metagenome]|jgi:hypothetical protein|nr:hypothetical protein [Pyrinomonadaceae bacterium]
MKGFSIQKIALIIGVVSTFLFSSTFVWLTNAKPVLVEWHYGINFGSVCDPPFVILNPLRKREAEKVADEFLEKLKEGKLEVLDETVSDSERLEHIKSNESTAKIKSWFAGGRKEEENKMSFTYWIERDYGGSCQSMPTTIDVEKINGVWKVVRFNPTY